MVFFTFHLPRTRTVTLKIKLKTKYQNTWKLASFRDGNGSAQLVYNLWFSAVQYQYRMRDWKCNKTTNQQKMTLMTDESLHRNIG